MEVFPWGVDYCNYCGQKYDKMTHTKEPLYVNHDIQNCKKSERNISLDDFNQQSPNTLNKQPWYKNHLVIGGVVIVAMVIIGLVIYFTTKDKNNYDKSK